MWIPVYAFLNSAGPELWLRAPVVTVAKAIFPFAGRKIRQYSGGSNILLWQVACPHSRTPRPPLLQEKLLETAYRGEGPVEQCVEVIVPYTMECTREPHLSRKTLKLIERSHSHSTCTKDSPPTASVVKWGNSFCSETLIFRQTLHVSTRFLYRGVNL
jgi:hypothetical protein